MNKLFLLVLLSFIITCTVNAQKIDAAKVPAAVKTSFDKQFPNTPVKWEKEGDQYEANFKNNGHEMSALFETNGTMTESEIEIKISELPSAILDYIKNNRKGTAIKEAAKITRANGEVNYEAEVKGKDMVFDATGKFLKEQKD